MGCAMRSSTLSILVASIAFTALAQSSPKVLHKVLASPLVDEGADPDGCAPAVSGLGGPAAWQVKVERLLLDGKGLIEASRQAELNRYPLCIADQPIAKNAEVELAFVPHDHGIARTAGVVIRFVDPQDFYVVEADAVARKLRFMRFVNGERRDIAVHAAAVLAGKAHTLAVKAADDSFAISLDGALVLETRDRAISTPGRFGIWSHADSQAVFGDLFITVLD